MGQKLVRDLNEIGEADAQVAGEWLLDRLSRFAADARFSTQVNPGGGQFMLMLRVE